jgi:enoyl-CoA hydratase/carnithine racemase
LLLTRSVRNNVEVLRSEAPATPAQIDRLARDLVDLCREIDESDRRPSGLLLEALPGAFFVAPYANAREIDDVPPQWRDAVYRIATLGVPTVAALDGEATGAAWELALACDLRVASASSCVGSPEIRYGRLPAGGGAQLTVRATARGNANWLLFSGERLTAGEAFDYGLLQRVAEPSELSLAIGDIVEALGTSAPIALGYAKEAVRAASELPLDAGLRLEADLQILLQTTVDRGEGIGAFLDRRRPSFLGR